MHAVVFYIFPGVGRAETSPWSRCFLPVNWGEPGPIEDIPQGLRLSLVIKLNGRVNKEVLQGWQRIPPQPFLKEAEPTQWCSSVASAALGVDSHPCGSSLDHHLLTSTELPSLQARYPPPSPLILYMFIFLSHVGLAVWSWDPSCASSSFTSPLLFLLAICSHTLRTHPCGAHPQVTPTLFLSSAQT